MSPGDDPFPASLAAAEQALFGLGYYHQRNEFFRKPKPRPTDHAGGRIMNALANRYDFVLLFDVSKAIPNGDPDAGNLPRLDPETNHGLVSDVCLKRKVRNYVELAKEGAQGCQHLCPGRRDPQRPAPQGLAAVRPGNEKAARDAKLNPKGDDEARALTKFMCDNFFDIRTFGAVMSTGINCGQVRGPVQMTFASSIEPIVPQEITITRMAATNEAEKKQRAEGSEEDNDRTENRTMGRKHIVPYGLYRAHGFISAKLAERTGFSDADLDLLFEALGDHVRARPLGRARRDGRAQAGRLQALRTRSAMRRRTRCSSA